MEKPIVKPDFVKELKKQVYNQIVKNNNNLKKTGENQKRV